MALRVQTKSHLRKYILEKTETFHETQHLIHIEKNLVYFSHFTRKHNKNILFLHLNNAACLPKRTNNI